LEKIFALIAWPLVLNGFFESIGWLCSGRFGPMNDRVSAESIYEHHARTRPEYNVGRALICRSDLAQKFRHNLLQIGHTSLRIGAQPGYRERHIISISIAYALFMG
jgi:hypothetical protein